MLLVQRERTYDIIGLRVPYEEFPPERKQELRDCMFDMDECDFDHKRRAFDDWVRVGQPEGRLAALKPLIAVRVHLPVPSTNTTAQIHGVVTLVSSR
jgi:hypothetical protein